MYRSSAVRQGREMIYIGYALTVAALTIPGAYLIMHGHFVGAALFGVILFIRFKVRS